MAYQGSTIKVNSIEGIDTSPVVLGYGATLPVGASLSAYGGVSVAGVVTAAFFVGDASQMTGLSAATPGFTIAFSYLGV